MGMYCSITVDKLESSPLLVAHFMTLNVAIVPNLKTKCDDCSDTINQMRQLIQQYSVGTIAAKSFIHIHTIGKIADFVKPRPHF